MIYLDSAATSLQKPRTVAIKMTEALRTMASPGRGGHKAAMTAAEAAYSCRETAAKLFRVPSPEQVVFTFNATHGLNIAIHDLLSAGDKVVVSGYEHNSVMRPLHQVGGEVQVVRSPLFDTEAVIDGFAKLLPKAKAAVCTAMSNVYGFRTPIREIAALCRKHGVPLVVDASQLAGCGHLDFSELGAAYMAMPGHKGLLGPQGTGLLLCGRVPKPLLSGGTGSESKRYTMPDILPDGAEAGTHNIPGIAGLEAGMHYVLMRSVGDIERHERKLLDVFMREISDIDGIETFYSLNPSVQGGVVSLRHCRMDCEELAARLGAAGVAVRGGMHCAPCAHETGGTYDRGTVRFSFSPFNTEWEVRRAAAVLKYCINKEKT